MQEKVKRQSWVDFARGIAIILVLYRHVFNGIKDSGISVSDYLYLEYFNIIFYSFRMPLFFIVSGVFLSASFAKRGLSRYIDNKIRMILYPYFVWGSLQITLQIVFYKYVNSDRAVFDYLYLIYQPREIAQFWYLYALFNVSVLYVVMKYLAKITAWQQIVLGVIMYYASAVLHRNGVNLGFLLDVFNYYIFIVIGDLLQKFIRDQHKMKIFQSWKTVLILLFPFVIFQGYFLIENLKHPEIDEFRFVEYYLPGLFFLIAMAGCAFIISVCFIFQRYHNPNWLRILGKYSLYIYVAHVIAFASVRTFIIKVLDINYVPILLVTGIFVGLVIPIGLYKLSEKLHMTWVFYLKEKPRQKESNLSIDEVGTK